MPTIPTFAMPIASIGGIWENPRDLMRPYPAEPMRMWPISTRVNKPENHDASIVEPTELSAQMRQRSSEVSR